MAVSVAGLVLHGSPNSLPTYRVALMLRLCGVGFRFRYVSFQRRMHLTPEFRALSRWGQVPVLEHDGRVLLQSGAILQHLAESLGRFSGDAALRQAIREWLFWDADRLYPSLYGWYSVALGQRGLLPLAFDDAVVARWNAQGEAALGALEALLADRCYLVGGEPTIADICSYACIAFARLSGRDLAEWPHVVAWAGRVEALPGFAAPFDLLVMSDAEIAPR
jgi:glutathione S-transferase